jgi:uncharacterized Zn-binding protein involved in type VI secretion
VIGFCPNHVIPGPMGAPVPSPPMPFSAPLLLGTVSTVLIGGKAAAVAGSSGVNTPPHPGLHPADPFFPPPMQRGQVLTGSATVLIGGRPAANAQSTCQCCIVPGNVVPTVMTVLIG